MTLKELIENRHSIRKFKDTPVPDEDVLEIIDAIRRGPSSENEQPWHFVIVRRKNPLRYYEHASIFMMTSAYEGWGMTVIEAMQNGVVPIVFNSYSAVYDILTDEEDGIIIENNDIKNYADKVSCIDGR